MQKFPALKLLHDLGLIGREAYQPFYNQWIKIYDQMRVLRGDAFLPNMGHHDANVDLFLRKVESEQLKMFAEFKQFMDGGSLFLQIAFSRHWILSSYELLRTTVTNSLCEKHADASKYCKQDDCFRCTLNAVREQFSIVRMPLAKFEPKGLGRNVSLDSVNVTHLTPTGETISKNYQGHGKYHGDMMFENTTGSLGWSVSKGKTGEASILSRRRLSDLFLNAVPNKMM